MEIINNNENSIEVILTPGDVESAVRRFICTCHPKYSINWILSTKYNLGSIVFVGTRGDENNDMDSLTVLPNS